MTTPTPDGLFDPAPYATAPDHAPRTRSAPGERSPNAVYDPSWFVLARGDDGPDRYMHRYSAAHASGLGGIITVCGQIGRRIRVDDQVRDGAPIYACPDCLTGRKRRDI